MIITDPNAIKIVLEALVSDIYGVNQKLPSGSFGNSFRVTIKGSPVEEVLTGKLIRRSKDLGKPHVRIVGDEGKILLVEVPKFKARDAWYLPDSALGYKHVYAPNLDDVHCYNYLLLIRNIEGIKFNKGRQELELRYNQCDSCTSRLVFSFGPVMHSNIMSSMYDKLYRYMKVQSDKRKLDYEATKEALKDPNKLHWDQVHYLKSVAAHWKSYVAKMQGHLSHHIITIDQIAATK